MTPEYIIMTSDYQTGADYAKKIGLEIHQWQWIRDRFKDPVAYKRHRPNETGWGNTEWSPKRSVANEDRTKL